MASAIATRAPESLKGPVWFSLAFHGVLALLFVGSAIFSHTGDDWGGPGGAITVGVVGSLPAVPLPTPEVVTPSRVVDESKGLYKAEPEAKPVVPPDATPIPKFEKNKPPKYETRPSKVLENPKPPPPNAVPYGGGGTPTVPTTSFAMGPAGCNRRSTRECSSRRGWWRRLTFRGMARFRIFRSRSRAAMGRWILRR
jgi:hypothetical protein